MTDFPEVKYRIFFIKVSEHLYVQRMKKLGEHISELDASLLSLN